MINYLSRYLLPAIWLGSVFAIHKGSKRTFFRRVYDPVKSLQSVSRSDRKNFCFLKIKLMKYKSFKNIFVI